MEAQVNTAGATTSTPHASLNAQVRKTRPSSSALTTSPRRNAVGPNAALTSAATPAHNTSASTSSVRSSLPRVVTRRRKSRAATTSAKVLPTIWPMIVPAGWAKSASSRSPITMPGHRRMP